ncbi:DUF5994 family protein [Streptomyces sp. NPDC094438]|uniref:DUF5994 family protein n=1 Tax=Streptomyces sp. NPDC094438 TaxID=3366061 RepID=UPI00382DEF95
MTATITDPQRETPAAPAARVALKSPGASRGLLDGAWWPRSRDLLRELPALIAVLDPLAGRITRIAVNPRHWPVIPRRIPVAGHVVKAGWFKAEQDPHKLLLLSYPTGRRDLLVIPPHTDAAAAARLMAAATDETARPLTASALIATEEALHGTTAAGRAQDPEESWEYEGGASSTHIGVPARPSRILLGT